jgi:hypothetical protein
VAGADSISAALNAPALRIKLRFIAFMIATLVHYPVFEPGAHSAPGRLNQS